MRKKLSGAVGAAVTVAAAKVIVLGPSSLVAPLTDDEISVIKVRRTKPPMIVSQDLYFCLV